MSTLIDNFRTIYSNLIAQKDFFEVGPGVYPALGVTSNDEMKQRIEEQLQSKYWPKIYRKAFLEVLLEHYDAIDKKCMSDRNPYWFRLYLSMLTNAALQPDPRSKVDGQIRCLQALVSDLYKSFTVSRSKLGNLPPLQQVLPPLVTFTGYIAAEPVGLPPNPWQSEYPAPPFMLHIDLVQDLDPKIEVGIMNMSPGFREHPMLWSLLTHEVAGHAVLNADRLLLRQISREVRQLFSNRNPILGSLWYHWCEEAASDICGMLNMGPSFAIGAFLFYTAISALIEVPPKRLSQSSPPKLENAAHIFQDSNIIDYHYPEILMPHLLMGAIEHMDELSHRIRLQYLDMIRELTKYCTGTQVTLEFPTGALVPGEDEANIKLQDKYDLDEMQAAAHAVGGFLVTKEFRALNQNNLQALETWDNADEERAQLVAARLKGSGSLDDILERDDEDEFDDGCLLAGAMLALIEKPEKYYDLNKLLTKALERSYRTDKILHKT
ncbi:MAG: hypothetical protein A4E19_18940 [Nitrospira sp. SG-bin1]|nr:MAG: hypothetical protein A4E19_18940 [Nitrospira sp. SG-bin1]